MKQPQAINRASSVLSSMLPGSCSKAMFENIHDVRVVLPYKEGGSDLLEQETGSRGKHTQVDRAFHKIFLSNPAPPQSRSFALISEERFQNQISELCIAVYACCVTLTRPFVSFVAVVRYTLDASAPTAGTLYSRGGQRVAKRGAVRS